MPPLWPALIFVLFLCIAYLESFSIITSDTTYIESLRVVTQTDDIYTPSGKTIGTYLKLRPLIKIAPCRGDWNIARLLIANFLHGNLLHLLLNLIGIFAGVRICSTFLSFPTIFMLFVLGGTFGISSSMLASLPVSEFVPHIGASAGIFALMGTYYVYNFNYRTRYFFWFPSQQGIIPLKTSWFFFVDVILLEMILSAAQLSPGYFDGVDHMAHVGGFVSGAVAALLIRKFQRWPPYLQTRLEYTYWSNVSPPKEYDRVHSPIALLLHFLEINPYNDLTKLKLLRLIGTCWDEISDQELDRLFTFMSPTFIRLYPADASHFIKELLARGRVLPHHWLARTPYDSVIRLAHFMANPQEEQHLLYRFVLEYRKVHSAGDADRKLEFLVRKLSSIIDQQSNPSEALASEQKQR
ncbi:MAG: rhomboid family intramembrane serine protease [Deltaproteobacteria bacterium]|nr:rhomboid family intramembrane serine protease [Deltaproteobacteria bacterium]